jgi:hypothetical protein
MITMQELEPLALCMATQQLFDRRFRSNFADNLLLRDRDIKLGPSLVKIKRELNSTISESKYLEGHKTTIINNIDRILALVTRYAGVNLRTVESIVRGGKDIIKKVMAAESFDEIGQMESMFKSQITLPVYELFTEKSKGR